MKKWIVPVVLLVAVAALISYLRWDDFAGSKVDGEAYLEARATVDALELELWQARNDEGRRAEILAKLDSTWHEIEAIREPTSEPEAETMTQKAPLQAKLSKDKALNPVVIGGIAVCIILLLIIVMLLKKVFGKRQFDDLEAQKAAISGNSAPSEMVIEERFRNPKNGYSSDDLTFTRTRSSKRPSIIDEANAYAEAEAKAEQEKEKLAEPEAAPKPETEAEKAPITYAFENAEGVPENRIISSPAGKPTLRPTTKERITTALQSLSSALTRPRGISRDQTMHIRTQSRNSLGKNALDLTRFDKEQADMTQVKKLKSKGCTPGMIAQKMNISQDEAETLITKVRESE